MEIDTFERLILRLERQAKGCETLCRLKDRSERSVQRVVGWAVPELGPEFRADEREEAKAVENDVFTVLGMSEEGRFSATDGARRLMAALPEVVLDLDKDAEAILAGDPAARSLMEVKLAYPGFLATAVYRVTRVLWRDGFFLVARVMSEWAHRQTGIDIHPGAEIGVPFVIDHGTGTVVGETAVIGSRVKMYQGVTLGSLSVDKTLAGTKRHPTIEDDVVIYSHATILGGDTVVGAGSTIGGNVWLTESVGPESLVVPRPGIDVKSKTK